MEEITALRRELPAHTEVIVYCVGGRWISQKSAHFPSELGVDVRSRDGGIEAWKTLKAKTAQVRFEQARNRNQLSERGGSPVCCDRIRPRRMRFSCGFSEFLRRGDQCFWSPFG